MHAQIDPELVEALQRLAKELGGSVLHIAPTRICDHCHSADDNDKEVFPYYVTDETGKEWNHLCNDCFDLLFPNWGDNCVMAAEKGDN